MNINKLTRQEKEELYKEKMTKLQLHWKNPIDDDWDFSDWTDESLEDGIRNTIGQLRFEMLAGVLKVMLFLFIALVIIVIST